MKNIINTLNLDSSEIVVLKEYCMNKFSDIPEAAPGEQEYLAAWNSLMSGTDDSGVESVLNSTFCKAYPVKFIDPEGVKIEIYKSFAGDIPIIYVENADDFELLITNMLHKGIRPENITKTGASFVSGKTLRFIVLSSKPYSNVTASELGLDEKDWQKKSMLIRRAHECTHFFTKQAYGIAYNNLHDELMADFMGLYDAFGFYKADWFLRFMGVIEGSGKRLDVYTKGLSPNVKTAVALLTREAAYGLERWTQTEEFGALSYPEIIKRMCRAGIAGMIESNL